ncbi:hypothetical protein BCV70DRAFT_50510 [Testicularia cyperi]|uniref:Uncharacterized protein n=1 Tax=Testicularia cyperi TaxID=1882483 RepID=A0A317XJN9_9BASI|nr:hypothetical protein BCV70DRAFT_50510 [Testicularia cyperi]
MQIIDICGHRTLKAPHPVRSAKLSKVSPSQYCGGGPRGNPRCCSSFFPFFLFLFFWFLLSMIRDAFLFCLQSPICASDANAPGHLTHSHLLSTMSSLDF